eukprot:Opistho-2@45450
MASRDLDAAREAYAAGDIQLSVVAHDSAADASANNSEALHMASGKYIKSVVYGGLDGIITTFSVVAAVAGSDMSTGVVIVMGFANLIADGISMGFGDFLSSQAEYEFSIKERTREVWELENNADGERREMVEIYISKGVEKEDAETVIGIMSKYKDFFVDHMLVTELGLMPPDADDSPAKNGLVTFVAFLIFGLVPLIAYIGFHELRNEVENFNIAFFMSCMLTGITLFLLGAVKSKFSTQKWWISGMWVLFNGALAAASAYLVGWGLNQFADVNDC